MMAAAFLGPIPGSNSNISCDAVLMLMGAIFSSVIAGLVAAVGAWVGCVGAVVLVGCVVLGSVGGVVCGGAVGSVGGVVCGGAVGSVGVVSVLDTVGAAVGWVGEVVLGCVLAGREGAVVGAGEVVFVLETA